MPKQPQNTLEGIQTLLHKIKSGDVVPYYSKFEADSISRAFFNSELNRECDGIEETIQSLAPSRSPNIQSSSYANLVFIFPVFDSLIGVYAYLTGRQIDYDLEQLWLEIKDINFTYLTAALVGYMDMHSNLDSDVSKQWLLNETNAKNASELIEMLPRVSAIVNAQQPDSAPSQSVEYAPLPTNIAKLAAKHEVPEHEVAQFLQTISPYRVTESKIANLLPDRFDLGRIHGNRPSTASLMKKDNNDGLFMGGVTASCMSIGGDSEEGIVQSVYTSHWCDYLVVYKDNVTRGNIMGAMYIWTSADENGKPSGLVVNSYEHRWTGAKDFFPLLKQLIQHCIENDLNLYFGYKAGQTPDFTITVGDENIFSLLLDAEAKPKPMDPSTATYIDTQVVARIPLEKIKGNEFCVREDNSVSLLAQEMIGGYFKDGDAESRYHVLDTVLICKLARKYGIEPLEVMQRVNKLCSECKLVSRDEHWADEFFLEQSGIFSSDLAKYTTEQLRQLYKVMHCITPEKYMALTTELREMMMQLVDLLSDQDLRTHLQIAPGEVISQCEVLATILQKAKIKIDEHNIEDFHKIAKICRALYNADAENIQSIFQVVKFFDDEQIRYLPCVMSALKKMGHELTVDNCERVIGAFTFQPDDGSVTYIRDEVKAAIGGYIPGDVVAACMGDHTPQDDAI